MEVYCGKYAYMMMQLTLDTHQIVAQAAETQREAAIRRHLTRVSALGTLKASPQQELLFLSLDPDRRFLDVVRGSGTPKIQTFKNNGRKCLRCGFFVVFVVNWKRSKDGKIRRSHKVQLYGKTYRAVLTMSPNPGPPKVADTLVSSTSTQPIH